MRGGVLLLLLRVALAHEVLLAVWIVLADVVLV